MDRLSWALGSVVLLLGGSYLRLEGWWGLTGYLVIGLGLGIGCAVVGSLLHDALGGGRQRRY